MSEQQKEIKEDFCGACLAMPLALAGAGAAGYGGTKNGSNKNMKKILLWGGIGLTLLSVIIAIYYMQTCKSCR